MSDIRNNITNWAGQQFNPDSVIDIIASEFEHVEANYNKLLEAQQKDVTNKLDIMKYEMEYLQNQIYAHEQTIKALNEKLDKIEKKP